MFVRKSSVAFNTWLKAFISSIKIWNKIHKQNTAIKFNKEILKALFSCLDFTKHELFIYK